MTRDNNEHIREIVNLHFNDDTGAPYWRNKKHDLSFDPLTDIEGWNDLVHFHDDPAYTGFPADKLKETPKDFIPNALTDHRLFSTGGRTGTPKWLAYSADGYQNMLMIADELIQRLDVTPGRDWLYIGPTGPHLFGWAIQEMAARNDSNYLTIDLDPRWIRTTKMNHNLRETGASEVYLDHLQSQSRSILEIFGRDIGVLISTPSVIGMMAETGALNRVQLDAVVFAGQAIKPENYQLLNQQLECPVRGWYGNTLFGAIPQAGFEDGTGVTYPDKTDLVKLEITHPDDGGFEAVGYGERGQVIAHIVREGLFAPYHLEDDAATRVEAGIAGDQIGHPAIPETSRDEIEEGVY